MSYDKRTVRSWIFYDFANSIYPAVVMTAVYPLFFVGFVVGGEGGRGDFLLGAAVSLSALLVAFSSPLLGAIADRSGVRKKFFGIYVAVCLAGVALMTTLQPGMVVAGFLFLVIANVGFESAVVFYNAYLPDIAPPERLGEVSGKGFGWGYLGSALGLVLVLPLAQAERYELIWLVVVAFFLLFSIPAFRFLPADRPGRMGVRQAAVHGITSVIGIAKEVWRIPNMRRFLLAYFFFIDGVLTIIAMAGVIAMETFGFTTDGVIVLFLIVQFSALAGALTMAKPTDRLGPKKVLTGVLVMWVAAGVAAYFIQGQTAFYVLAVFAGIGLGNGPVGQPRLHGVSDSRGQGGADVRLLRAVRKIVFRAGTAALRRSRSPGRRQPAPRPARAHWSISGRPPAVAASERSQDGRPAGTDRMTIDTAERRHVVRERYATAAATGGGCCPPAGCGDLADAAGAPAASAPSDAAEISCAVGYDESELASVPDGANLGLGCGNPVALASLGRDETVLDLGSGAGFDCFLAAERVGPEGRVIGVDMTPEMVERARENARTGGYGNVEFRLGEIEALPVGDASVDVVISNCVLNLSADRPRVLAEVMRVLKPGGRVMISDLVSERAPPDFVAASRESLVGCLPVPVREYEAELAGAGFGDVRVEPMRRYPAGHVLADPAVQAVMRGDPDREADVRAFVESIHGGTIEAVKGDAASSSKLN